MKAFYYILMIILIVGVGGFFMFGNLGASETQGTANDNGATAQKIVLSMKNYNYYPNTITVKQNALVRIYLDQSVVGCYRGFTIRDFGIAKYLKTPDDYVEFTPKEKGVFSFACSMGMGRGKIIVE